ncbi:MAG: heme-copper oxidase subunit III [Actinobacteria bacterium]|nr:heme-copper oxidase subunit III [Actinomycetota bacterium]
MILLGLAFLAGQAYEYSTLGFGPADNDFTTLFFTITGFHGFHVAAGVVILILVMLRASRFGAEHHGHVEAATLLLAFRRCRVAVRVHRPQSADAVGKGLPWPRASLRLGCRVLPTFPTGLEAATDEVPGWNRRCGHHPLRPGRVGHEPAGIHLLLPRGERARGGRSATDGAGVQG